MAVIYNESEGLSLLQVSSRIRADLLHRAAEFHITLEDVSITHLTFGKVIPPSHSHNAG